MRIAIWGFLLTLTMGTAPAWAVLGQYESSVSVDQRYLVSNDNVQAFQGYKVHQLTTAKGTVVREYISPQGLVFGITWQARFMPNMQQLLGSYATDLQTATRAQTQTRHLRGLIVRTSDFVYANSGHMRFWRGSAYVPSLVPTNVSVEVVR